MYHIDENEMKLSSLSCLISKTTNLVLSKLYLQTNEMIVRRMQSTWNKLSYMNEWMVVTWGEKMVDLMPTQRYKLMKHRKSFAMSMTRRQDTVQCTVYWMGTENNKMQFEKRIGK